MFLEEKVEEIKKMYTEGKTQREIAQILGCKRNHMIKLFKLLNIQAKNGNKQYEHNLEFFKEINCEANAYFLGLLYADGCVHSNKYSFEIKLQEQDKHILEVFRNYISPEYELKFIKSTNINWKNMFKIKISSKIICEQLIKLGCIPKKSLILEFSTYIPDHLLHHFIRGCSDGDGSIFQENTGGKGFVWDLTSTHMFLTPIKEFIKNKFDINARISLGSKIPEKNITSNLVVGGSCQVEIVLDWLYKDATIYLERKYEKYMQLKNRPNKRTPLNKKEPAQQEPIPSEITPQTK